MKKHVFLKLAILLVGAVLLFGACRDAIFYYVAQEVAPVEPRIRGGPTNMVTWDDLIVVASGFSLNWYRDGRWNDAAHSIPRLGGRISMLAATSDYLYALILNDNNSSVIRRFNRTAGSWENMEMGPSVPRPNLIIQTIFAPNPASNNLFIGIGNTGTSDVLILRDASTQMELLKEGAGMLAGAAFDDGNYFLPIRTSVDGVNTITNEGNTILRYDAESYDVMTATGEVYKGFVGIINTGDGVVAIDRGGNLFDVTAAGAQRRDNITMEGYATGALAVWEDISGARLLLAGRQGSLTYTITGTGFTFGYVEVALPLAGNPFHEPGNPPAGTISTVDIHARYVSTIGRHGVSYIFQTPANVCGTRRLFASTQRNGLWSYRDHFENGETHWNAEY